MIAHLLMMSALTVCHAGSLSAAFAGVSKAFNAQHPGVQIVDVSGGSVALARRLASGAQPCDVFASADYLDIDLLLKPAGLSGYTIVFAHGRMVLAYLATDPKTQGVTAGNWYRMLVRDGVRIGGAHPFLDPGGYRSHMIFGLAENLYGVAGLYNALLEHYVVIPAAGGAGAAVLGRDYDFQIIYEHSAAAAAGRDPAYRYIRLPERVDLSSETLDKDYGRAGVTLPGLGISGAAGMVRIPAARAAWGVTIPEKSADKADAIAFLELLLGPTGKAALDAAGPAAISPATVSARDFQRLPRELKASVRPN